MKCVMGIVRPSRGTVILTMEGTRHDLTKLSTEEIVSLGVAMVPEGRRLFPQLTVEENLLLGAFRRQARTEIGRNRAFCYETLSGARRAAPPARRLDVGRPAADARHRARAHVGAAAAAGRRALGRARADPGIDSPSRKIKELKERYGLTVLMAEQNFHQAIRIADRGYIIVHGEIVFEGDVPALEHNELVKNYYLGAA